MHCNTHDRHSVVNILRTVKSVILSSRLNFFYGTPNITTLINDKDILALEKPLFDKKNIKDKDIQSKTVNKDIKHKKRA